MNLVDYDEMKRKDKQQYEAIEYIIHISVNVALSAIILSIFLYVALNH